MDKPQLKISKQKEISQRRLTYRSNSWRCLSAPRPTYNGLCHTTHSSDQRRMDGCPIRKTTCFQIPHSGKKIARYWRHTKGNNSYLKKRLFSSGYLDLRRAWGSRWGSVWGGHGSSAGWTSPFACKNAGYGGSGNACVPLWASSFVFWIKWCRWNPAERGGEQCFSDTRFIYTLFFLS